ncbi:hypothetical protein FIBSPDRAFT_873340, partial [Athelia psychrophila]
QTIMFIPILTNALKRSTPVALFPRKGGGGGSTPKGTSIPVTSSGKGYTGKGSATTYGGGGGKVITIPSGSTFSGRSVGGGTRNSIYGTSTYGSGYPVSYSCRDVYACRFPYYYRPVVYPVGENGGHDGAYGDTSNTTRPGGPMAMATFILNSDNTTFWVIADNSTVAALITTIDTNCTLYLSSASSPSPVPLSAVSSTSVPQPEQAVQYYRASSVVLSLAGYNNSAGP